MVESRLPWWLVLLLGVWVAGLTVWSWPRAQRQVRWGAGLLSLVYLVMLFTALGGDPRIVSPASAVPRGAAAVSWAFVASSAVAVLAGVFLLGRPSGRGQLAWFLVLTLANAASCFAYGTAGVGAVLLAASAAIGVILARELRRGARPEWSECLPASRPALIPIGLVGATGFVLALMLFGTLRFALRVETSRSTASHRFSAIPSVDGVRAALESGTAPGSAAGPFELAIGRRADVIVLLSALAFLVLAMHHPTRSIPDVSKLEDGHSCPSGFGMEERTGRSAHPPNLHSDEITPHGGPA